jgi:hypothetical protein
MWDTNFWGVVYGSLAALPHLRKQGGALVNVGSEVSEAVAPLLGLYAASKHAVKGYTDALRMELEKAADPVQVTLVKPGATDTPFAKHAKNYMDQEPNLPSPIYAPEVVGEVILHCAQYPEREMFAAGSARMHSLEEGLMPRVLDWVMEELFFSRQKSGQPARHAEEALYSPTTGLRQRGNAQGHVRESSIYTKAAMHPVITSALLAGLGLSLFVLGEKWIQPERRRG